MFPLRPYHHQDIEKTRQENTSHGDIIPTTSVAQGKLLLNRYQPSIVLHVWSFYLETHTSTLSKFREAFIVHPFLWKSKQTKGKIVNAKGIQIRNRSGGKGIHKKDISQMSIICPKYTSFDGESNVFFLSFSMLKCILFYTYVISLEQIGYLLTQEKSNMAKPNSN